MDRRELERMLWEASDPLSPPEGAWDEISRRARRRKIRSATLSVAAAVVIVAGAVPAVIAVHDNSNNATLNPDSSRRPTPTSTATDHSVPAPLAPLAGFFPESLSFVSQDVGFLWGSVGTSQAGVVAKTTNDGRTWTQLPTPGIKNEFVATHGAAQIRFVNGDVGFLFGSTNLITQDAGQTWQPFNAPGYIADLEAMHHRIWALIRPSASSDTVRLYSATAANPTLRPVAAVPVMHGSPAAPEIAGAASIAVSGKHVDVIVGDKYFYNSPNGRRWQPETNPCPATMNGAPVRTTLVSTTTTLGIAVACGSTPNGDRQSKLLYQSVRAGARWTALPSEPSTNGLIQTVAAGSQSDIAVGTTHGGAQITHNGGGSWAPTGPSDGTKLSFVGFINLYHVVAVADRASANVGSFAVSEDSGRDWSTFRFGS